MALTKSFWNNLGAIVLAGATGCGDTNNYYTVDSGNGNTPRSYVCEDLATYLVGCYPPKEGRWEELIDICEEMKFESTSNGHSLMDCSYDAKCDLGELESCISLVPELD